MEIKIISFGKIAEMVTAQQLMIDEITGSDALKEHLESVFPELKNTKYKIAVNKQIVQGNINIPTGATIALMPPFSGG